MYVNPFWFGVLMTILVMLVMSMIAAFIHSKQDEPEEEMTEEQFKKVVEELTGKQFRIINKDGVLIAEPVEEKANESEDH